MKELRKQVKDMEAGQKLEINGVLFQKARGQGYNVCANKEYESDGNSWVYGYKLKWLLELIEREQTLWKIKK